VIWFIIMSWMQHCFWIQNLISFYDDQIQFYGGYFTAVAAAAAAAAAAASDESPTAVAATTTETHYYSELV
jgi:Na+/glutamate symporter